MPRTPAIAIRCVYCMCSRATREPYRWYEWPLTLIFVRRYRCRHCGERFLASSWREGPAPQSPPAGKKVGSDPPVKPRPAPDDRARAKWRPKKGGSSSVIRRMGG